jgi:hypothetical protein
MDQEKIEAHTEKAGAGEWHPWFAWRPVRLISGERAWLRVVSRRDMFWHHHDIGYPSLLSIWDAFTSSFGGWYEYAEPFHVLIFGGKK